ncbi:MAG: tetratricopeptide repeat protein [Gemmatimonadales bacterium]
MSDRFLSSDDFDEQAHQLYTEGRYDDALALLNEGLEVYPQAVELHVGKAYARLAREEFAWARRSFEAALAIEPDHEDALAGFGEILLKLGDRNGGLAAFERILALGFQDDHDLMLQIGRALFRESLLHHAHRYFELAVAAQPESAEAAACTGYATHRLGREDQATYWMRRALELDPDHTDARIYFANLLYDRGESEAALYHFDRTTPDDHYEELGLWRSIELRKATYRLPDEDPELVPWFARLGELVGEPDSVDMVLAEVEARQPDGTIRDPNQLDLFGTLVAELHAMQKRPGAPGSPHLIVTLSGDTLTGTWEEILWQLKFADVQWAHASLREYMLTLAERGRAETGVIIPTSDPEAFLRASAQAGIVRIIQ